MQVLPGDTMAALNKEIQQAMAAIEAAGIPPLHTLNAEQARDAFATLRTTVENPTPVHSVENVVVSTPAAEVPVRIYKPSGDSNLPAMVWFHGGGWVLGDLDTADLPCRDLCAHSGSTIISVDYRLAPESIFPAAFNDCLAVTNWAFDNADKLGINENKIAVGGDSAGGNLAACVALEVSGTGKNLKAQMLIYPVIDVDFNNTSYNNNADGYFLTKPMMQWFWDQYVPDESARHDPQVIPLHSNLTGLPPAIVLTVKNDPLCDEGIAYARALEQHGVKVISMSSDDTIHGYFSMDLDCSHATRKEVAEHLQHLMN